MIFPHRAIVSPTMPEVKQRSVLEFTSYTAGPGPQRIMSGPQPDGLYPAVSKCLLYDQGMGVHTTVVESNGRVLTRSGIDELADNRFLFVGTSVANIPFVNISHGP